MLRMSLYARLFGDSQSKTHLPDQDASFALHTIFVHLERMQAESLTKSRKASIAVVVLTLFGLAALGRRQRYIEDMQLKKTTKPDARSPKPRGLYLVYTGCLSFLVAAVVYRKYIRNRFLVRISDSESVNIKNLYEYFSKYKHPDSICLPGHVFDAAGCNV